MIVMIKMPATIPTIRIKLGCLPLCEDTVTAGAEGSFGAASTGDIAERGAAYQRKSYSRNMKRSLN